MLTGVLETRITVLLPPPPPAPPPGDDPGDPEGDPEPPPGRIGLALPPTT